MTRPSSRYKTLHVTSQWKAQSSVWDKAHQSKRFFDVSIVLPDGQSWTNQTRLRNILHDSCNENQLMQNEFNLPGHVQGSTALQRETHFVDRQLGGKLE